MQVEEILILKSLFIQFLRIWICFAKLYLSLNFLCSYDKKERKNCPWRWTKKAYKNKLRRGRKPASSKSKENTDATIPTIAIGEDKKELLDVLSNDVVSPHNDETTRPHPVQSKNTITIPGRILSKIIGEIQKFRKDC